MAKKKNICTSVQIETFYDNIFLNMFQLLLISEIFRLFTPLFREKLSTSDLNSGIWANFFPYDEIFE